MRSSGIDCVPVALEKFAKAANAEIRTSRRLTSGTAGNTMFVAGRHLITVNPNDSIERQRFTVLHEIAHIVLDLASKHGDHTDGGGLFSYARRPKEEVICDTFAAECLLPHEILQKDLKNAVAGFQFVDQMAQKYEASLSCTASRIAVNAPCPCAYVLSQDGYIRFATYSASMRQTRFWISNGIAVPSASVTGRCLKAADVAASGSVPAHIWTSRDEFVDVDLTEDVRVIRSWNQALTLLWLEEEDSDVAESPRRTLDRDEDEPLLKELDGVLPWPGRKKRKS